MLNRNENATFQHRALDVDEPQRLTAKVFTHTQQHISYHQYASHALHFNLFHAYLHQVFFR
eukprot:COSAG02_NODE_36450_length_454_cov_1.101408_1_plen_60_part_10